MRRAHRAITACVALMGSVIASGALAGCVVIPTTSEVKEGQTEVVQSKPILPILEGPEPGASATAIVQGFVTAAAGGTVTGFETAREFLTPEASAAWDPLAHVTVFDSRDVEPAYEDAEGMFVIDVSVTAHVDVNGVLTEASADATERVAFQVALDAAGEYRIASLDDGIIIPSANFTRFYRTVSLAFASVDRTTMVPEVRWFPNNEQMIATAVASELIEGPSAWLADAVVTGFPPSATLDVDAVVVEDGVARVALAPGSAGDPAARSLANAQLEATLTQLSTVQEVEATVGNVPLGGDDSAVLDGAALPSEVAAVVQSGRLGLFDGATVAVTPAEAGLVPAGVGGLALSYDLTRAALLRDGDVVVTDVLGTGGLLPLDLEATEQPTTNLELAVLIEGQSLVAPSFDKAGWAWTAESGGTGALIAARADATPLLLAAPWLEGRSIQAVAVSRDGARIAVLSRINEEQVLEVAAIIRDAEGNPLSVGVPLATGAFVRPSVDVAWADDVSLVTLTGDSGEIAISTVGGWTVDVAALPGATGLSARNGERTLLGIGPEGTLEARSGSDWRLKAEGVTDVAYAG